VEVALQESEKEGVCKMEGNRGKMKRMGQEKVEERVGGCVVYGLDVGPRL